MGRIHELQDAYLPQVNAHTSVVLSRTKSGRHNVFPRAFNAVAEAAHEIGQARRKDDCIDTQLVFRRDTLAKVIGQVFPKSEDSIVPSERNSG